MKVDRLVYSDSKELAMRATEVTLSAPDARLLHGTLYEAKRPRGALVLAGATAVPARAYAPLCEALAWSGLTVLNFDYRGIATSAQTSVRSERAGMGDWGRLDLEGALAFLDTRTRGLPLLLLGHSVGGQLLGLAPSALALRGALLVGAQHGHWRNWTGPSRLKLWLAWHLVVPFLSRSLGHLPMRALRMGEYLPPGVAAEWARWGRHPEHLLSSCSPAERERYARLGFPMRLYGFTDDDFAPPVAIQQLAGFYPGAQVEVVTRSPADVGASAIGHFGWLKPRFRETLWREMAAWLLSRADAVARPSETLAAASASASASAKNEGATPRRAGVCPEEDAESRMR
jgi:predicted alpha/beta hydrolase